MFLRWEFFYFYLVNYYLDYTFTTPININIMSEVYDWIVKIISTCSDDFHFDCVDKLIELFYIRFGDADKRDDLIMIRSQKWNETHGILI